MGQLQADEHPATQANVDQLLHDLQQLVKYAKPADQWQETGPSSAQQPSIIAKGR